MTEFHIDIMIRATSLENEFLRVRVGTVRCGAEVMVLLSACLFVGVAYSSFKPGGVAWPPPPPKGAPRLSYPNPDSKFVYTSMENFVYRPDMHVDDEHHNSNAKFVLNLPGLSWTRECKVTVPAHCVVCLASFFFHSNLEPVG